MKLNQIERKEKSTLLSIRNFSAFPDIFQFMVNADFPCRRKIQDLESPKKPGKIQIYQFKSPTVLFAKHQHTCLFIRKKFQITIWMKFNEKFSPLCILTEKAGFF